VDKRFQAQANVGRNYWGFDTNAALTYLDMKHGFEASVAPGIEFNTRLASLYGQGLPSFWCSASTALRLSAVPRLSTTCR
jgi:hypothetical protein